MLTRFVGIIPPVEESGSYSYRRLFAKLIVNNNIFIEETTLIQLVVYQIDCE